VWKSEDFGPFFPKESSIYLELKNKIQVEKIAKKSPEKKIHRWLQAQDCCPTGT
jgi:hypothetical protein